MWLETAVQAHQRILAKYQWHILFVEKSLNVCVLVSRVQLCATLWTVAHQSSQSMGFSRQARIQEWIAMLNKLLNKSISDSKG